MRQLQVTFQTAVERAPCPEAVSRVLWGLRAGHSCSTAELASPGVSRGLGQIAARSHPASRKCLLSHRPLPPPPTGKRTGLLLTGHQCAGSRRDPSDFLFLGQSEPGVENSSMRGAKGVFSCGPCRFWVWALSSGCSSQGAQSRRGKSAKPAGPPVNRVACS